jgi:signal transduction histidine kinase
MSLPSVIGDSYRLEQVMTNLIGNAIKFSPPRETITISAKANSHSVIVQVRDNGIGIPPEELDNIWQRYYQAQHNGERSAMGTGLGLHIAKQIIEKHRGKIWAESEGEKGSTFSFTLPRAL